MIADISFGPVWDQKHLLLGGIWLMLRVAVASMAISVVGGLALALMRRSRLRWVSALSFVLIQVLRGIALYVLVLWLFNGLAVASGIKLTPVPDGHRRAEPAEQRATWPRSSGPASTRSRPASARPPGPSVSTTPSRPAAC